MAKIVFGLSNLYFAKITTGENGTVTYGTPVKWTGARELSLSATGDNTQVYADDVVYVTIAAAAGYEGDLTVYHVPESFLTDILGMQKDSNGVLIENENDTQAQFALLGEFKTETTERKRFVLYNCAAKKADFGGVTKEDTVEPHEYTFNITATAAADTGAVKATVINDTEGATQFASWFNAVYVPTVGE